MPNQDPDQQHPVEEQADQTLAQKVEALQERVREMGFVSDASDDKAFMDEAWGEENDDAEGAQSCEIQTCLCGLLLLRPLARAQ